MTGDGVALDAAVTGRWLAYLATIVLVGAAAFPVVARAALPASAPASVLPALLARARRLGRGAAVVALVAGAARLWAQALDFRDLPTDPVTLDLVRPLVLQSAWGTGWLVQMVVAAGALVAFALLRPGAPAIPLVALAAVVASPLTGHAAEHPLGPTAGIAVHAVHAGAAGLWLGTLCVLLASTYPSLRHLAPEQRPPVVRALVTAFSRVAFPAVCVLALAGAVMSYGYVGSVANAVSSAYGRTLLAKLACMAAAAALGAWNWRRVTPRLGSVEGVAALRTVAGAEVGVGVIVVLVTAVLVGLPAPALGGGE